MALRQHRTEMRHAWINGLAYADIKDKWNMDTCIKFLMMSETTQKRLPGAPQPSKPCSVKDLVCQRLQLILSETDKPKIKQQEEQQHGTVATATTTAATATTAIVINNPINLSFIDTLNLLLMIIRHAFSSYPRVILPMAGFTAASKLNHDIKILQQQLLDIVAWLDNQNHDTSKNNFLFQQQQQPAHHQQYAARAQVDKYFE